MAVVGVGIDLVDVARMEAALDGPLGERFRERVFTATERAECERQPRLRASRYASRFAAKEAVLKALGRRTRWGFAWPDIEIARNAQGAPEVRLSGRAAEQARHLGACRVLVSLSHESTLAMAEAVAENTPA